MTTTTLKKTIKDRFGSMAKFAKLINIDRYELQKFFAAADKKMTPERKKRIQELHKLAKGTKDRPVESDLTPEIRTQIREAIEEQFGGVTEFCEANPKFNVFSVWQIINGRRKTISAAVKKIMTILEIQTPAKNEERV